MGFAYPANPHGITVADISSSSNDVLNLYAQGKCIVADRKEFLDVILNLSFVKGNNLKAIEVYERTCKFINALERKDD